MAGRAPPSVHGLRAETYEWIAANQPGDWPYTQPECAPVSPAVDGEFACARWRRA